MKKWNYGVVKYIITKLSAECAGEKI